MVANKNLLSWGKANQFISILRYYYKSPFLYGKRSFWIYLYNKRSQKQIYFLTNIGVYNERCFVVCKRKLFLKIVFALGGSPTSHPISYRPHFVCKFSRHGSSSPVTWPQALRYWYSLTLLMHIVAQLRPIDLHNFLGLYQRVVSFWVPVNYPSLNEVVSMPGLWRIPSQFRLPHNASLCKLP
jgi:hypothetical protein